jgi:hypothetical protein
LQTAINQRSLNLKGKFYMMRNQVHPSLNPQTVAIGVASAQSAATASGTKYVRIACTSAAYIAIGANPTATSSSMIVPANTAQIFKCNGSDKVACLQVSAGGVMSVTEAIQD